MIIFTFAFNPETQEAAIAGNCEPMVALQLFQQLVIANAIKRGGNSGQEKSSNQEEEATKATEKNN